MLNNFIESKLSPNFAHQAINQLKNLIDHSVTFSLSGMPGVGGSIFLRYLALQKFAHFIYTDTYQLADITRLNYYQLLARELGVDIIPDTEQAVLEKCREQLIYLTSQHHRVVLILNRFDHLKSHFSNQLFADLMNLKNVNLEKIVFIFTANKPYEQLLPTDITADKHNLFSKTVYLKPYTNQDLQELVKISSNAEVHSPEFIERAIQLSGGHYQLLQLFLKSERLEPPFIDQFVKYQLKEIYDYLDYPQKITIKKIAQGKTVNQIDDYLLGVGIVKETTNGFVLFSQLLADYINSSLPTKMSSKEQKLFRLLKDNINKVVPSEKIFTVVWADEPNSASDWALSSLLYRLRKHQTLQQQGLIIESYKKTGYLMTKI